MTNIKSNVTYPKSIFGVDNKNVDSTLYPMHFVMGMFRPFECINMVAKKSVSGRGNKIGSNFLFYENKDGVVYPTVLIKILSIFIIVLPKKIIKILNI